MSNNISALLNTDALHEAEKLTGKSYKDDALTEGLGLLMHFDLVKKKREALSAVGDTHMGSTFAEVLAIYEAEGFEVLLRDEFVGRGWTNDSISEHFFVLFNREKGILAKLESHQTTRLNTTDIHFNWIANPVEERYWPDRCSGGFKKIDPNGGDERSNMVYVGHKDAREGLRHFLRQMERTGTFQPVWTEAPFLWLLNYREPLQCKFSDEVHYKNCKHYTLADPDKRRLPDCYDYRAITAARIARLPQDVQDAVRGR